MRGIEWKQNKHPIKKMLIIQWLSYQKSQPTSIYYLHKTKARDHVRSINQWAFPSKFEAAAQVNIGRTEISLLCIDT